MGARIKFMRAEFAVLSEIAEDILPLQLHHQRLRLDRVRQFRWRFARGFLRSKLDVLYRGERVVAGQSPRLLLRWCSVQYLSDFE
jgi:hypothetical protein